MCCSVLALDQKLLKKISGDNSVIEIILIYLQNNVSCVLAQEPFLYLDPSLVYTLIPKYEEKENTKKFDIITVKRLKIKSICQYSGLIQAILSIVSIKFLSILPIVQFQIILKNTKKCMLKKLILMNENYQMHALR